jgi:hypothetical protein
MYYVENPCPICHAGAVGFRRCSDGIAIVLMCTECDAVWLGPVVIASESAIFPTAPDYLVEGLSCSTGAGRAGWADLPEIERKGWAPNIFGEGAA